MLKYRLNTKYPGANLNTIYNSYGNLSILGESKELSKGAKKAYEGEQQQQQKVRGF
jgi:hypothetical protein